MSAPLYTSATPVAERTLWRTDPAFVAAVVRRFGPIHLDAAASLGAAIPGVLRQITPEQNALDVVRPWRSYVTRVEKPQIWLNPPWGPGGLTGRWIDRALVEADRGARLLVLVPESSSAAWWWRMADRAVATYSLGRLAYVRPSGAVGVRPGCGSTLFYVTPSEKGSPGVTSFSRWHNWAAASGEDRA